MEIENIDYVVCPICNKKVKRLCSNGHLRIHKITTEEFTLKYPMQPLYCKKYSENLSKSQLGKIVKQSTRDKISKNNKGNMPTPWNKGLTKETDERVKINGLRTSITRKKRLSTGELLHNSIGQKRSQASRLKMRLKRVEQLSQNGNTWPAYNKKACDFFKVFDELNNTKGQYATSPHEHYIDKLGYWVDYINFDLKIIIEWDEPHHFEKSGELKVRDIERQKEIQDFYPDFEFRRIKQ